MIPQSVGIFSKITGNSISARVGTDSDIIDFQTNVTSVEVLFKLFS